MKGKMLKIIRSKEVG